MKARHAARCPHCEGLLPTHDTAEAEIGAIADGLRAACRAAGAAITGDDRVDEATAALLIGRATKTLSNWRHTHRPIPFVERRKRVLYSLADIANWMKANTEQFC
jgi:N-acyl-D-aspartate/D-glutamate deacylase